MFEGGRERGGQCCGRLTGIALIYHKDSICCGSFYIQDLCSIFFLRYDKLHNLSLCEIACFKCLISDGQNTSIFIIILISYNVRGRCIFKSCQLHTLHMINCLKCTVICRSTCPSKIYYGSGLPVSVLCSFFLVILENCMCIPGTTTKHVFFG